MQFLYLRVIRPHVTILLTSMLLFTTGCEDDDHDHDHDEDHTDADGFILETEAGVEVYREFKGTQTGGVTLSVGETLELMVHFLDHEGNEIEHSEDDDHGDGLVVSENDTTVAVVEVEGHDEEEGDDHGDEEHGNALHVEGVSAGTTSFKLQLMHDGHADYTSTNNVPVTVN
ncbi:MAG: hypothetical protein CMG06_05480 [Candidatus Marinimicrobia bacterium]|nr:hypothetical protein [Candidatus Neomarinimicrobiota bacterium]